MNLYKITPDDKYNTFCGVVSYVLAEDETSACKKVRETFRKWGFGDVECKVIELLGKEGEYVRPCDHLFICDKKEGGSK